MNEIIFLTLFDALVSRRVIACKAWKVWALTFYLAVFIFVLIIVVNILAGTERADWTNL